MTTAKTGAASCGAGRASLASIISHPAVPAVAEFHAEARCKGTAPLSTLRRVCVALLAAGLVSAPASAVDKTWNKSGSGSGADPNNWTPYGVPGSGDKAILPNLGFFYTVTTDANWHIDDLEIQRFATGWVNGYALTVNKGGDIYGTLYVQNTTFTPSTSLALRSGTGYGGTLQLANGTIAGSVNTSSGSQVLGYGTITGDLTDNNGLIRAEGGVLNIGLGANDHDNGTLSAATGGTLHIRNTANVTNRATIALQGGTLWGYQYYTYNLINEDSSSQITGHGTIDRYYLQNNYGAVLAPSGGMLTLVKGFANARNDGTINLASGATLNVGQAPWANYGMITMTGGAIAGQTLQQVQSHTLAVTAGSTNAIQNVSFTAPYGAAISNGAALSITGTGTLSGSTIRALTGGGKFNVSSGGVIQGRGTVEPDMDVGGTLTANSSGNTLTVSGAVTVLSGGTAKAESGGTLSLTGEVRNRGEVKATGGTVAVTGTIRAVSDATGDFSASSGQMNLAGATFQNGVRNTFTAYSNGTITLPGGLSTGSLDGGDALRPRGGTLTLPSGTTLTHASGKTIAGYGFLLEDGRSLANRGVVDASGGTLELRGTVLADPANTGDFSATSGILRVAATLQPNLSNTFTANSGGTVKFLDDLNTSLFAGDGLRPRGGTLALEPSGATLTNASGKTIAGYGQLLEPGRNLVNLGTVRAEGGTLTVPAAITNSNTLTAASGAVLSLTGTLDNDGQVVAAGGGVVRVSDAAPTGTGTFTAGTGGIIRLPNGFTNADLTTEDALQLSGGMIALSQTGAMTNEPGKIIHGHGTLLEAGQSLYNKGLLEASGTLVVGGSVINTGNTIRASSAGDHIQLAGGLTNLGVVEIGPGAALSGSTVTVTGGVTRGGRILLDEASMTVQSSLNLSMSGLITDKGRPSSITVYGDLDNSSIAVADFEVAHSALSLYSFGLIGAPHRIRWVAEDRGAELSGFDLNMAIGKLTFGDGVGMPKSDMFELWGDTTIYCYGLRILEDAYLDLGGRTIYYLREGVEYNGIVGTGFLLEGSYVNGEIIEVVPEPAVLSLLVVGSAILGWVRTTPSQPRRSRG